MRTRASTTRRGAVALTVVSAALAALGMSPANANHLLPGEVAFVGAYATDGVISQADAALADTARAVDWQDPGGAQTSAEGRFTGAGGTALGGACGTFTLAVTGDPAVPTGYVNSACLASAPDGPFEWRVRWFDGTNWTAESVATITIDRAGGALSINTPSAGSLVSTTIAPDGARVVRIGGNATSGDIVKVYEGAQFLGQDTTDAQNNWEVLAKLPTGNHTVTAASGPDGVGNTSSASVNFDLDANEPTGTIISPANLSIYTGDQVLIEGTARDTNNQAFGGIYAVEVHIHDPLTPDFRPENLTVPPAIDEGNPVGSLVAYATNASGVLRVGKIINTNNAECTPGGPVVRDKQTCSATGVQLATWKYDASFLPIGVYTLNVVFYDKAGNTAAQPEKVTFIRL